MTVARLHSLPPCYGSGWVRGRLSVRRTGSRVCFGRGPNLPARVQVRRQGRTQGPRPCPLPSPPPPTPSPEPIAARPAVGPRGPLPKGSGSDELRLPLGGLRAATSAACGRRDLGPLRRGVQVDPPVREHRGGVGGRPGARCPMPAAPRTVGRGSVVRLPAYRQGPGQWPRVPRGRGPVPPWSG